MNSQNLQLASQIISKSYIDLSSQALNTRQNLIKVLLSQRCLPDDGWDDLSIEHFLQELAMMDTNNFPNKMGVGEREGRVFSELVNKRHYYMAHGIGRSGDISAEQPKAAGSSLLLKLTEYLVKDTLKICGYQSIKSVLIVPLATGMALSLVLSSLRGNNFKKRYVIWPRIDQKTCLKCIYTSGLEPLVIENIQKEDKLTTNIEEIEKVIKEKQDEILCVLSTTSCFAPRIPDDIEKIAQLCAKYNIGHVVNNAYGLQCTKIANSVNMGIKNGRVDCLISSTDKNLMVPVGGAFIYSHSEKVIQEINQLYPGRASAGPILDVFITLLSMGKKGLKDLLSQRKENLQYLKDCLQKFAERHSERLLDIKENTISLALTLTTMKEQIILEKEQENEKDITSLGGILYSKRVMGSRILSNQTKSVCGIKFKNYGSHSDSFTYLPYMTIACAIGMEKKEIDQFLLKLEDSFQELKKKKVDKQ
ncbi:O-phosphoseryl-tRNA(Sec) selenium transferase (macronuclear) [Tetrahymena thermophila SB210]|uniref:O-phosphoseryl-tRNA(Sec) selenium transferase n=1 Tax=Tetrahymena thermophila (strain SB210) TaxID=312017 RepID=Q22GF8_TETTS|nr:O-phosphoseryl-tRNA(Sec) selenium transferase [Tetrahymena thermophila SB210]EAR84373.1 O-phosphoseryl-tRNA(Sec) selenium transferase [Tetrahymena thermophila SB210]|eukprot:XP_001032036.1 O-phosphoseryl-tRNA(Sec) selenium transferase [Tetrahymena thermophila SB210]